MKSKNMHNKKIISDKTERNIVNKKLFEMFVNACKHHLSETPVITNKHIVLFSNNRNEANEFENWLYDNYYPAYVN